MSADRLKQLAIGLFVVLFFWGAAKILRDDAHSDGMKMEMPGFAVADVALVEFGDAENRVRLERVGNGNWLVDGKNASEPSVLEFLGALNDTTVSTELIAMSVTSHERMGISEESGNHVVVSDASGSELSHFVYGDRSGADGVYVRKPGGDNVYLLRGPVTAQLVKRRDDLREKTILQIDTSVVAFFSVMRPSGNTNLFKSGESWSFVGGGSPDSTRMARAVGSFANLLATGFPTEEELAGADFGNPDIRLVLRNVARDTLAAVVFVESERSHLVRLESGGEVFKMPIFSVERAVPADSLLRGR